ncbi:MAG: Xaa-Pro peptidase family protein [Planctomycetota bacterium]|nr:Xaa-Pro peptidase family protein [Planctomycetota bacterium]
MDKFELNQDSCRLRQSRLLDWIRENDLAGVAVTQNPHVQWLSGVYFPPMFAAAAFLSAEGLLTLVAPHKIPADHAADEVDRYEAKWHSTMRNDQAEACITRLFEMTGKPAGRIGVEFSTFGPTAQELLGTDLLDAEPQLYYLRRRKETDELASIEHAIAATEKMYERARSIIRPGISEIEVFNELQSVAVEHFGEPLTGTGNDYQCNSRGGPPRDGKTARAGELYILDLGPAFRGFYADNARTLAVTQPDDQQELAWNWIMKAFEHVESSVKPGKSCQELFRETQAILDESPVGIFNHHLGHGIGMFPHEAPHLNPNWNDTFEVGDVFTAEPGLYDAEQLRAGMRIENDYLVTETGVRKLTLFGTEL